MSDPRLTQAKQNMGYLFDDPMGRSAPPVMAQWILAARAIAQGSHEPRTKVGAVILNHHAEPLSVGCNNFATQEEECFDGDRSIKIQNIVFGEEGAMFACMRKGIPLRGTDMVSKAYPGERESKLLTKLGIKRVFVDHACFTQHFVDNWLDDIEVGRQILKTKGVQVVGMPMPVDVELPDLKQMGMVVPEGELRTGYTLREIQL